jgi:magnesium chelatase family protein
MLAARLASILPPLPKPEHIEALQIYSSFMERLPPALLAARPPYRAPHHQASATAILGTPECPGELALAHGGVLFLDELPEFRRDLLEALREPLETGEVRVSRAKRKSIWKARTLLVAACNNCPCGWSGSATRLCPCSRGKLTSYGARLSGPLLDRIDLHVNMPERPGTSAELLMRLAGRSPAAGPTARMREQVRAARAFAAVRNRRFGVEVNRDLPAHLLVAASGLTPDRFADLVGSAVPASASSRAVSRCLRVARTIADLGGRDAVSEADLAQAWSWQAEGAAVARGEILPGT